MSKFAKIFLFYMFMIGLVGVGLPNKAEAHRVNVFAWLEGDRVVVECAFSRSQPVNKGQVTVYDNVTNKELIQGRTDAAGHFSFKVPSIVREGHGLRIEINAGQGHVSDWVMAADELYEAAALTAGFDRSRIADEAFDKADKTKASQKSALAKTKIPQEATQNLVQVAPELPELRDTAATPEHVRQIVNESLDAKLAPIHRNLAAMEKRGIGIVEIFGGIGWIIGLVGLWLYYRGRRKDSNG